MHSRTITLGSLRPYALGILRSLEPVRRVELRSLLYESSASPTMLYRLTSNILRAGTARTMTGSPSPVASLRIEGATLHYRA
jgi:hypothetical protein